MILRRSLLLHKVPRLFRGKQLQLQMPVARQPVDSGVLICNHYILGKVIFTPGPSTNHTPPRSPTVVFTKCTFISGFVLGRITEGYPVAILNQGSVNESDLTTRNL